jgi:hypothetical protein
MKIFLTIIIEVPGAQQDVYHKRKTSLSPIDVFAEWDSQGVGMGLNRMVSDNQGLQSSFLPSTIRSTRYFISAGLSGVNPLRTAKTMSEAGVIKVRFNRKNSRMILLILFLLTALFTP